MASISAIIPVFNSERYLSETIESILSQDYKPDQIIIVNDGSTDRSGEIAESYLPDVQVIHQNNKGIAGARNRGIEAARGDYLSFLDADDIWVKEKLHWQMEILSEDSTIDAVFGHVRQFYSPELPDEFRNEVKMIKEIVSAKLASAMLVRRESFLRVGYYNPKWAVGLDQDWIMRAEELNLKFLMMPQVVYLRRLHKHNNGRRLKKFDSDRLHILKEALNRRRENK